MKHPYIVFSTHFKVMTRLRGKMSEQSFCACFKVMIWSEVRSSGKLHDSHDPWHSFNHPIIMPSACGCDDVMSGQTCGWAWPLFAVMWGNQ